jgi:hypothetical protein
MRASVALHQILFTVEKGPTLSSERITFRAISPAVKDRQGVDIRDLYLLYQAGLEVNVYTSFRNGTSQAN